MSFVLSLVSTTALYSTHLTTMRILLAIAFLATVYGKYGFINGKTYGQR